MQQQQSRTLAAHHGRAVQTRGHLDAVVNKNSGTVTTAWHKGFTGYLDAYLGARATRGGLLPRGWRLAPAQLPPKLQSLGTVLEQGLLGTVVRYEAHYNRFKPELSAKPWKEEVTYPARRIDRLTNAYPGAIRHD